MRNQVKPICLLWCILLVAGYVKGMNLMAGEKETSPLKGGPCQYKEYRGKALITSMRPKRQMNTAAGASHECVEVKFTFLPGEQIRESFVNLKDRVYDLKLQNGSDPCQDLIQAHGIKTGRKFDCILKVIVRGTCTPLVFAFPLLDPGNPVGSSP